MTTDAQTIIEKLKTGIVGFDSIANGGLATITNTFGLLLNKSICQQQSTLTRS